MPTYTSPQDWTTLDTFLQDATPTTNYSASVNVVIGEVNSAAQKHRSLFQFPGLTNGDIPPAAIVTSAKLYLLLKTDYSSNARTFRVYRSKRDVNISQCTWNIWKTGSSWASAGGFGADDCEQTDIGSLSFTATETMATWKEFSLTPSAIQAIISGAWTTPTLFVKADTETDDAYEFHSSNATTSTNRPYLVVEYALGGQVIIWTSGQR